MNLYQLIASACIACIMLVSCADNSHYDDDQLMNHPAADTVNIPDTIKNFPIPVDSTIKSTDTVAINY
jgi:hypothetical protein